ncbi:DUF885 family protein [Caulobacter sp. S45]|uniref:DUF885 domain-containing protein n=1 Tax=Caulobacter sp. S45 TaxID=1641861 RepID=UPI00131DD2D6|nr:DUF885 family protein [Caulobacter sp. S45]
MKTLAILGVAAALTASALAAYAADGTADARLKAIYDTEWKWRQVEFARAGGDFDDNPTRIDHLQKIDAASQDARLKHWTETLAAVDAIPVDQLSPEEKINRAVYREQLESLIADQKFKLYEMPFNSDSSFWSGLASGARRQLRSAGEYQAYIARLNDIARYYGEQIDNMRMGLKRGFSVPRETLVGRDGSILAAADPAKPEDNPFFQPFKNFPKSIPADEQASLRAAGLKAVQGSVIPAHQKLLAFYRDEYLPHARTTLAAEAMPDGKAFYRSQIKEYTTLDLSPEEIHAMGLKEVERIHAEMLATMQASGFKGSFPEFLQFLRTDPRFYAKTGDELLMRAAWISKKQDGKIGRYIGHLSRERFGIDPVPLSIAPFYTSGRGGKDGCLMNTYDLPSRPLYNLTALVLHECSPGHSLQLQLAGEQKGLPAFRRGSYISAYGEGWGLYVEKLGREMGMYETPYDEFGRETFEMWRACRLVVDTGIHHYGWTRQQAIDYLKTNTALAPHDIEIEVDRYITWPGQALSYKLGEMDIERQRAKAEAALGPKFDIRAFHDEVLSLGSVPLPVLDDQIDQFIARGGKLGEALPD